VAVANPALQVVADKTPAEVIVQAVAAEEYPVVVIPLSVEAAEHI
jgi:D-alanine-D-alanine ligase-like ATP-grasp enzyme